MLTGLACLLAAACLAADWPLSRHDRALTNRSPLRGDLTDPPRELWRLATGAWQGVVEVAAGAGPRVLAVGEATAPPLPAGKAARKRARAPLDWEQRLLDISGTGPVPAPEGYWGKLIPERRGLQRVAWTSTWGEGPSRLQCFSYEGGPDQPRLEWEAEPETTVYSPQVCLADVNGDGETEVVTALHYRVMIYEGHSGRKLHELRYHHLRNYGFFGIFFQPGDRLANFVNISDFASHFDVLDYNGSELVVAFRRDVEGTELGGITRHAKIVRPGPNPLEDIDGDGDPELTFNLFNDHGDGRWHVVCYQPLTGTIKLDLAGRYLVGVYDADGCGSPELFCQSVSDRHTTGWHPLSVLKVRGGRVQALFSARRARFGELELAHLPPTADTGAAGGRLTVAAGRLGPRGEPGFALLRPGEDGRAALAQAYLWQGDRFQPGWRVSAPPQGTLWVRRVEGREEGSTVPSGRPARVLLTVLAPAPKVSLPLQGVQARLVRWQPHASPAPSPIVLSAPEGAYLVTETSNDRVAAYRLGRGRPALAWERPGRGMDTGSGPAGGLAGADLDGDGRPEVLLGGQDPDSGAAVLSSVGLDGVPRWRYVFAGYDSERPRWNWGGLTLWTPAYLSRPDRQDVYVNTRRGTMHSDVSFVLDGRTGRLHWSADSVPLAGVPTWGFGGAPVACVDLVGTGLEQIVSLYPVCYYVVDGREGKFLRTVDLAPQTVLPGWAAYGVPVVADFLGNGGRQVLVPSPYVHGLLTPEGQAIWSSPTTPTTAGVQVGDFDGDGRLEVARGYTPQGQEPGRVEFLDGATGKPKWDSFPVPGLGWQAVVAADLDGDGADELVLQVGPTQLGALACRGGSPRLLWQVALPAAPARSIVADLDGDGLAELLVSCADGTLVALGGRR